MVDPRPITRWLRAHREGDASALDRLVSLVYDDLRRLARRQKAGAGATLDTTAMVHEAYLKLARSDALDAVDRRHFFAVAARAMRQVVVDHARGRARVKRGAGAHHTGLDGHDPAAEPAIDVVLAVDQMLDRLARDEPRLVRVVECRYFVGLSEEETAEVLGVSVSTVQRDWRQARRLLRAELDAR